MIVRASTHPARPGDGARAPRAGGAVPHTPTQPTDIHPIDCACWACLDADRTHPDRDVGLAMALVAVILVVSGALIGAAIHLICLWLGARP
jgi:hypothetical protein